MQADQWHDRWRSGRIGFHSSEIARPLKRHWQSLGLPHGSAVFVPFCGKSLDLLWLRDQKHDVVGVELSEIAVESFLNENGIEARRIVGEVFSEYHAPGLHLLAGDLFRLAPQVLTRCTAVYDRAALIALPAGLRRDYAIKLAQLTAPGTQTLLVTLEYPPHELQGPPFSVDSDEVNSLYSKHHDIQLLDRADIWASDPLRTRGVSSLHEVCYRLTRL
jgi:thiopurine S-methyltransferase